MAKRKMSSPSIVLQGLLEEYQITLSQLATDTQMTVSSIRSLISGKSKLDVQTAFRLAKYFGNPMQFWTDLQLAYDVDELKHNSDFQNILKEIPKAKKKKGSAAVDSSKSKKPEKMEKPVASRRRGRPKTPKDNAQNSDSPPMAKKRGRPRKSSTSAPETSLFDSTDLE
jgi:addiction module HigA family antidote